MNRREKQRREERKKPWMARSSPPELAHELVLQCFEQATQNSPKMDSPLYVRVSTKRQESHLRLQLAGSLHLIEELGLVCSASYGHRRAETGKSLMKKDRKELHRALRRAGSASGYMLAPCVSRVLRSPDFDLMSNPEAQSTEEQLRQLREILDEVEVKKILVLSPPLASPDEEEEFLKQLCNRGRQLQCIRDIRGEAAHKQKIGASL